MRISGLNEKHIFGEFCWSAKCWSTWPLLEVEGRTVIVGKYLEYFQVTMVVRERWSRVRQSVVGWYGSGGKFNINKGSWSIGPAGLGHRSMMWLWMKWRCIRLFGSSACGKFIDWSLGSSKNQSTRLRYRGYFGDLGGCTGRWGRSRHDDGQSHYQRSICWCAWCIGVRWCQYGRNRRRRWRWEAWVYPRENEVIARVKAHANLYGLRNQVLNFLEQSCKRKNI